MSNPRARTLKSGKVGFKAQPNHLDDSSLTGQKTPQAKSKVGMHPPKVLRWLTYRKYYLESFFPR